MIKLDRIDRSLLAEILEAALGIPASSALSSMQRLDLDPAGIGLDHLVLAARPNRAIDDIVATLKVLAKASNRDDDGNDGEGKADEQKKDRSKAGKGKSSSKETPRFDVTLPEPTETDVAMEAAPIRSRTVPRVETLAGYGEAQDWAMDLKADLELWQQEKLAWSDTSSRLLLHGPPGTGKTTFARALCNTLNIPMIATSVGRWLEPGYLGDVLQLLSAAFDAARANAPSILFIDEIDNIGRRGGTGANSDYWNSLVNRMLEILDGAARLEGVVVLGATNIPDGIDRALPRSGRLERQIELRLPDTDALTGILRFHLGSDADEVIRSRPAPALTDEEPSSSPAPGSSNAAAASKAARPAQRPPQGGPI
ncbi:MAG: ATP-binding protein [Rhizobium sp.]|nr:ATP-binding protein [Rhizobium sp.]